MTSFPAHRSRSAMRPSGQPPWVVLIVVVLLLPGLASGWTANDVRSVLYVLIPFLLAALVLPVAAQAGESSP